MSAAKRKRGLGRGLDALMGDEPAPIRAGVAEVPVVDLTPNRFQPRTRFDEDGLEELAESIRAQGVIQPIVAMPAESGSGYVIVAGERRWRAAQRAGLEVVPVVVRSVSGDQELLELALVENLQRADLDPVEEAEAYRALGENFSLSQEAIAQRVGRARSTVTNSLRLLRLPAEIQDMLRDGRLSAGQARPLLTLDSEEAQIELARLAVETGLSARELEERVREPEEAPKKKKATAEPDANTQAAAESLTRRLQTQVDIRRRGEKGMLRVHFHSEEELMRLYDLLMSRDTQGQGAN